MMNTSNERFSAAVTLLALVVLVSIDKCKALTEPVKTTFCSGKHDTATFPNIFGHKTQDEALFHMHTFSPLINTFCSDNVANFACSVFLPAANSLKPCRSFCEKVYDNCTYAMDQLQFQWPEIISCEKFPISDCDSSPTRSSPRDGCSATIRQPICSGVVTSRRQPYFAEVNQPFTNYFNHASQDQAVFEFNKYNMMLVNLIATYENTLIKLPEKENKTVNTCPQDLAYLLCTLYVPRCGEKKPTDYGITKEECKNTLGTTCSRAITSIKNLGYNLNVKWPPVPINCSLFPDKRNVSHSFKPISFPGLLPPPPAVRVIENGPDYMSIAWKEFSATFLGTSQVKAGLLYKVNGSKTSYIHRDYNINSPRVVRLDNLKPGTTYDVFLGSVEQNKTFLPGPFVQLQLKTDITDRVSTPFCTEYYNFTIFPNVFGDKNEADAIFRMHTFFPLFDTMCSKHLKAFICSAFLPPYDSVSKSPQKPCSSLCSHVFDRCRYAIERLKFKWPEELNCEKLPLNENIRCFKPPKFVSKDLITSPGECTMVKEQSICSFMTTRNGQPFFSSVKKNFTNYFKHTSQDQAVFELSKQATLLSLFASFRKNLNSGQQPDAATQCVRGISNFLCTLHFPTCGDKNQYQITKFDCLEMKNAFHGKCSLDQVRNNMGYSIKWPSVNVNCDEFTENEFSRDINYNQITFNNSIPPPAALKYTKSNSTTATWTWRIYQEIFGDENGVEFLYKPAGSETTFAHHHVPKGNTSVLFNADTSLFSLNKTYEVFVGVLDGKTKLPGRLTRIDYVHGTSVLDIPNQLDLCYKDYKQTVFPNLFGDQTIEKARLGMHKFFPLVYTLCSERLTRFLCSVFLPGFNTTASYTTQRPCQSACEEIYRDCVYAIDRTRFFWPPKMECDQFGDEESCDGLEESQVTQIKPDYNREEQPRKRSPEMQCKPTPPNRICGAVFQVDGLFRVPIFNVTSIFAAGETNYFNHTSKEEAIYELSRHLPLLSSLWHLDAKQSRACVNDLTVLLCHLHLPACPLNTKIVSRNLCLQIMNTSTPNSNCHLPVAEMRNKKVNFEWPPVEVNCFNRKWFGVNATLGKSYSVSEYLSPSPPPKNIRITLRSASTLFVQFEPFFPGADYSTQVLYRENGTIKPYVANEQMNVRSISLALLAPGNDYEMKVATVFPPTAFPSPFITLVKNTYGRCQAETTGDNVTQGLFFWKTTDAHERMSILCPYKPTDLFDEESDISSELNGDFSGETNSYLFPGQASRNCICTDVICKNPKWDKPVTSRCGYKTFNDSDTTQHLSGLFQALQKGEMNAVNVSKNLVNLTANTTEFQEDDVVLTLLILEDIIHNLADLNQTGPNIVRTLNNILNVDSRILGESQINTKSSTRYLSLLNQYLENVPIEHGYNVSQEEGNLAVHAQEFRVKNFEGAGAASFTENKVQKNFVVYDNAASVQPFSSQASLTIPKSLFEALNIESKDQKKRLYFAVFRKTPFFQSFNKNASRSNNKTVRKKNSFVIAGSVKGGEIRNLTDPVVTAYYPLEKAIDESAACVFWDFELKNGFGDWSGDGCYYKGTKDGLVTCNCNHLTNFAILMDVYIDDHNEDVHDKALSIISYIGCAVSLVGLILTIITILIFKELRSKVPTQILLHFCIALSFTLIVFLIAAERSKTSSMASCRAGAVALHYFVLVAFMWMAIEAFNMYLAFVKVMPSHYSRFMLKCCVAGWGLPAIVVIITAALAIKDYGDEHFCRLRGLPFQVAFLAPVLIILIGNSIMFVLIFRSILTSGRKVAADRKVDGLLQARRGAAILVVLGLTWLFGVLAIKDAKLPFQYLFCIFNAFQGLLVFIFYCVLSVETRAKYRKLMCGKDDGKDSETARRQHHGTDTRFHEIPTSKNTRSDVHTDSTATSATSPQHVSMEFATFKSNQEKDSVA